MALEYNAPPTLARFMKSEAFGRLAAGPVGSGKTTACVIELLRRAIQQAPGKDGLQYTRFAVVRQTLKQLKDTVLKDCNNWLANLGMWKVSDNTYYLDFDRVRSEWVFIPLEDQQDQARLLSMQLTGAWLSECIEMNIDILAPVSGRLRRYPSADRGVATWSGIIADTNFPTEMSDWHKFMEAPPSTWQIFKQPGGLAHNAENLNYLFETAESRKLPIDHPARLAQGRKYYENLIGTYGSDSSWIKRYVNAEYGQDPSGLAVFQNSYRADFHLVDSTMVIPGYPIVVGQDFGRNPWSLICQPDHMGRLIVHEEVPATNIGLEKHVVQYLRPKLSESAYFGSRIALVGDPAGVAKDGHSEETSFELLARLGLPCFKAPTNDIDPRLRAVEAYLSRQTNGGPSLVINRRGCPKLALAMGGGYRFAKTRDGTIRSIPDKNGSSAEFSHVADCLQYVALVCHGGMVGEIARRLAPRINPVATSPVVSSAGWT